MLGDGLGEISACFTFSAVEKIVIPAGVRVIQAKAFNSCERLRRVTFAGDGPEAIKLYAFASSGLESFNAPPALRKLESQVFANCSALRRADFSACAFRSDDFISEDVFRFSALESVTLPTLRVIGERKFMYCNNLKYVVFGDYSVLKEIKSLAFYGCVLASFAAPPSLERSEKWPSAASALTDVHLNGYPELGCLLLGRLSKTWGFLPRCRRQNNSGSARARVARSAFRTASRQSEINGSSRA